MDFGSLGNLAKVLTSSQALTEEFDKLASLAGVNNNITVPNLSGSL